jgi:hypothetical protein
MFTLEQAPGGGGQMYGSTVSLTSVLEEVGGQGDVPATFSSRKTPVHVVLEAVRATGPAWTGAENHVPTGIRPPARSESLYRYGEIHLKSRRAVTDAV